MCQAERSKSELLSSSDIFDRMMVSVLKLDPAQLSILSQSKTRIVVNQQQQKNLAEIIDKNINNLISSSFHMPNTKQVNWSEKKSVDLFYKELLNALESSQQASIELIEKLMAVKGVSLTIDYNYHSWLAVRLIPRVERELLHLRNVAIENVIHSSRYLDSENVQEALGNLFDRYLSVDGIEKIKTKLSVELDGLKLQKHQEDMQMEKRRIEQQEKSRVARSMLEQEERLERAQLLKAKEEQLARTRLLEQQKAKQAQKNEQIEEKRLQEERIYSEQQRLEDNSILSSLKRVFRVSHRFSGQ